VLMAMDRILRGVPRLGLAACTLICSLVISIVIMPVNDPN
jgi:hypothetical protein